MSVSQFGAALSVLAALVAVAGAITAFRARRAAERAAARTVEDGTVCGTYRPPATPADSGLCARCGMSDYKHAEATGA